jgi:Cys-rich repeat protein
VPEGPLYVLDFPPDCHATTACDGAGNATLVIDQSNTPTADNPCLAGTCNKAGATGTMPLPSGTRCSTELFKGTCNGAGSCVQCLADKDCPLGQTCNPLHNGVGEPCSDTNCGGACPACVGKHCAKDVDCASRVCDPQSQKCVTDPQCLDQQPDGNETDVDCGGGTCSLCAFGKACLIDVDCASLACDAISQSCVADHCVDHKIDADETDQDCGGTDMACPRCGIAKKCFSNWDCVSGHFCNGSKVCQ